MHGDEDEGGVQGDWVLVRVRAVLGGREVIEADVENGKMGEGPPFLYYSSVPICDRINIIHVN